MAAFIGDGLPNFEIRDVQQGTDLLVKTPPSGAALAQTPGRKPAALMRGHGAVVVGENLPRAVGRSIYLEMSAQHADAGDGARRPGRQDHLLSTRPRCRRPFRAQDYSRAWPMWRDKALKRD